MKRLKLLVVITMVFSIILSLLPSNLVAYSAPLSVDNNSSGGSYDLSQVNSYSSKASEIISKTQGSVYSANGHTGESTIVTSPYLTHMAVYLDFLKIGLDVSEEDAKAQAATKAQGIEVYEQSIVKTPNLFTVSGYKDVNGKSFNTLSEELLRNLVSGNMDYVKENAWQYLKALKDAGGGSSELNSSVIESIKNKESVTEIGWYYVLVWKVVPFIVYRNEGTPNHNRAITIPNPDWTYNSLGAYKFIEASERSSRLKDAREHYSAKTPIMGWKEPYDLIGVRRYLNTFFLPRADWGEIDIGLDSLTEDEVHQKLAIVSMTTDSIIAMEGIFNHLMVGYGAGEQKFGYPTDDKSCNNAPIVFYYGNTYTNENGTEWAGTGFYGYGFDEKVDFKFEIYDRYYTVDADGKETTLSEERRGDAVVVKPGENVEAKPLAEADLIYSAAKKNCDSSVFKKTEIKPSSEESYGTDPKVLGEEFNWISNEAAGGVKGSITKNGTVRFNYLVEMGDINLKVKDIYYDGENNPIETVWRTPETGEQKTRDDNIIIKSSDAQVPDSISSTYGNVNLIKTTLTESDGGLSVSGDFTEVTGKMTKSNEVTFEWRCIKSYTFTVHVYDLYLDANTGEVIGRSEPDKPHLNKEPGPIKRTGKLGTTLILNGNSSDGVIMIDYDNITLPYNCSTRDVLSANFTALFAKDRLYRGGVKESEDIYEECKDEPKCTCKYVVSGFGLEPNMDPSYYKIRGNGLASVANGTKTDKPNFPNKSHTAVNWNGVTSDFWIMYVYEVAVESSVTVTDVFVDSTGKELERIIRKEWAPKVYTSLTEVTGDIKSLTTKEIEDAGYKVDNVNIFGVKLDLKKTANDIVKKKKDGVAAEVKWSDNGYNDWKFTKDETESSESITVGGKVNAAYNVEFTYIVEKEPKGFTVIDSYYDEENTKQTVKFETVWDEKKEIVKCVKTVLDDKKKVISMESVEPTSHFRGSYAAVTQGERINELPPYTEGEWESYYPKGDPIIKGSSYKYEKGVVKGTYLSATSITFNYSNKKQPIEFFYAVEPHHFESMDDPTIASEGDAVAKGYISIHLNADGKVFYGVLSKTANKGTYWPIEIKLKPSGWPIDKIDVGSVTAHYGNGNVYNSGSLVNYSRNLDIKIENGELVIRFEVINEFLKKWVDDELYVTINTSPIVAKSATPKVYTKAREWNDICYEYKLELDYITNITIYPSDVCGLSESKGVGTTTKPVKGTVNYNFQTWNAGGKSMKNVYYTLYDSPPASRIPWRFESTPTEDRLDAYAEIVANQIGRIGEEDAADWSVMAGVPSIENLCIAIGGTAWVVDAGGWIWLVGDVNGNANWDNAEIGSYSGPYGIKRTIDIEVVIQDIWGHSGETYLDNNWLNLSCGCGETRHTCSDEYCASGCEEHTAFCSDDDCTYCGTIGNSSHNWVACTACGEYEACCGGLLEAEVPDDPETEENEYKEAVYCVCGGKPCDTPHVHATCERSCSVRDMHQDGSIGAVAEGCVTNVQRFPGALNMYNQTWNGQSVYYECAHDGGKTPCEFAETYTAKEFNQLLAEGYTEPDPGSHGAPYQGCTASSEISCVYPGDNVFNFQVVEYLNVYSYRAITALRLDALCNAEITNVDTSVIESSAIGMSTTNAEMSFDMWRSNAKNNGYHNGNGIAWFQQFLDKSGSSKIQGACYRGTTVEGVPQTMYGGRSIKWSLNIRHRSSGNPSADIGVGGCTRNDYYPWDHMTSVQRKQQDDPWQSPYYWLGDCRVQITICATANPEILNADFAVTGIDLKTDYWGKNEDLFRPVGSTNHGDKYKNHTGTPISVANQQKLATHVANAWQAANNSAKYTINIISENLYVNAGGERFEGDKNCKDVIADVYGVDRGIKLFDYEFKSVGETHIRTHGNTYGDASSSLKNGKLSHAEIFQDPMNSKLMTFGYIGEPEADPENKYSYNGSGEMKKKEETLTEALILMSGKSDKWDSISYFDGIYKIAFSASGIEGYDETQGYRGWRGINDSNWAYSPYTPYIAGTNYTKNGRIGDFVITSNGDPGEEYFKGFWDDHLYSTNVPSMMTSKWGDDRGVDPAVGKTYGERCTNSGMLAWNYQWPDANGQMIGQQSPMQIMNIDMVDYCKNGVYSDAITVTNKYYNVFSFNNDTSMPYGSRVIAEDFLQKDCVYADTYINAEGGRAINDIVIHDPISVEYCQVIPNNYGAIESVYETNESQEDMRTSSYLSIVDNNTDKVTYMQEQIPNTDRNDYIVLGNEFYVWSSDFGDFNNNETGHQTEHTNYEYGGACYQLGVNDTAEGHDPKTNYPDDVDKTSDGYVYSLLTETFIDKREIKFSFPISYIDASGNKVVVDKDTYIDLASLPIEYEGYGQSDLQNFRTGNGVQTDLEFRYGKLFKFLCLESSDEDREATITFRTTAKNNGGDTEEGQWLNNVRDINYDADGIVIKECKVELVGRIGNLSISDTTDFRTSSIMKRSGGMGWLIEGVIMKADETTSRAIIAAAKDILLDNASSRGLHTYSVTNYADSRDTVGGKSGMILKFPLNSLHNETIASEYVGNEMKLGYNILMDVETMGEYDGINEFQGAISAAGMNADTRPYTLDITPVYMLYDYDEKKFYALELYAGDLGRYYRIWKAGEEIHSDVASLYTDIPAEATRRNISPAEFAITRSVLACHPMGAKATRAVLEDVDFIGTCSKLRLDQYNRTFIGSSLRNGFISTPNKDYMDTAATGYVDNQRDALSGRLTFNLDTQFFPTDDRLTSKISDYAFASNMQRYHFTIGLPSSTVAILAQDEELKVQGQITEAINILKTEHPNSVIVAFVGMEIKGEVWDLIYDASRILGDNKIKLYGGEISNFAYAGYHTDESSALLTPFMVPVAVFDPFTNATTDLGAFGSH